MSAITIACDVGKVSDGYHTFDELYEHRHHLFVALMMTNPMISWRAKRNSDGSVWNGWFVAGMNLPAGQITYHLPISMWEHFDNMFGPIKLDGRGRQGTFDIAPEWDGHTSDDVIKRLADWIHK